MTPIFQARLKYCDFNIPSTLNLKSGDILVYYLLILLRLASGILMFTKEQSEGISNHTDWNVGQNYSLKVLFKMPLGKILPKFKILPQSMGQNHILNIALREGYKIYSILCEILIAYLFMQASMLTIFKAHTLWLGIFTFSSIMW